MPRKRKQDGIDVLADLFALVPWWVPFTLALFAWLAVPPIGRALVHQKSWDSTWNLIGIVLGLVLAMGGLAGQIEKAKRRRLAKVQELQALSWREFEDLCAEAYRRKGYKVELTAHGADGGVDLVLRKGAERVFVQCKHYAIRRVDVRPIRELFGVMKLEGATGGIFICSGTYTRAAEDFARKASIELLDGERLLALLEPVRSSARGH